MLTDAIYSDVIYIYIYIYGEKGSQICHLAALGLIFYCSANLHSAMINLRRNICCGAAAKNADITVYPYPYIYIHIYPTNSTCWLSIGEFHMRHPYRVGQLDLPPGAEVSIVGSRIRSVIHGIAIHSLTCYHVYPRAALGGRAEEGKVLAWQKPWSTKHQFVVIRSKRKGKDNYTTKNGFSNF